MPIRYVSGGLFDNTHDARAFARAGRYVCHGNAASCQHPAMFIAVTIEVRPDQTGEDRILILESATILRQPSKRVGMNAPHADGPEVPRSDIEGETAVRAYERWVARGRPHGTQLQDWIEAEAEVRRLKDLAQRSREADTPLCDSRAESGRGEHELWISEEVGHRLFDSVPDAIVVVRRDGRIMAVNAQVQVMFGYKREEMLGRPVEMLLPRGSRIAM